MDLERFGECKKVKGTQKLMEALSSYGFVFEGLKNGRMPKRAKTFSVTCPKDFAILQVLELAAKKVANTQ